MREGGMGTLWKKGVSGGWVGVVWVCSVPQETQELFVCICVGVNPTDKHMHIHTLIISCHVSCVHQHAK